MMKLTFERAIIRRMIIAATILTINKCSVPEKPLRALIVLVTLLSTTFTPSFFARIEMIVDCYLVLLVLICLIYDTLYHCNTLIQVFITISSD
jgi:hypothetical protein